MMLSVQQMPEHPAHRIARPPSGRPFAGDFLCRLSEDCAAALLRVPLCDLRSTSRGRARTAFARQVAMYLAHVGGGLNMTDVGLCFGRDRTTVAHACAVVENVRDDPAFDRVLDRVEQSLALLRRTLRRGTARLRCGGRHGCA
ncbi:MAG: helix-turn-helix domain-containing protein [Hyphomicrobiales bacterium]